MEAIRNVHRPQVVRIPHGSVLGIILFSIYINQVLNNTAKLFTDDNKLYTVVTNAEEGQTLQRDIDSLVLWPNDWLLKFNQTKC